MRHGVARARPRRLDGIMINLKQHNATVSGNCRLRRRLARLRSQSRERRLKRTFACNAPFVASRKQSANSKQVRTPNTPGTNLPRSNCHEERLLEPARWLPEQPLPGAFRNTRCERACRRRS